MKQLFALLTLTLCALTAPAATVWLAWDANTEADLAGYNLYWGTASRQYSQTYSMAPTVTTNSVSNLVAGATYYFAVTAFNTSGLESDFSNEVSWRVPSNPSPPLNNHFTRLSLDITNRITGTVTVMSSTNVLGPWEPLLTIPVGTTGTSSFFK